MNKKNCRFWWRDSFPSYKREHLVLFFGPALSSLEVRNDRFMLAEFLRLKLKDIRLCTCVFRQHGLRT